jgi:hypothetical protein
VPRLKTTGAITVLPPTPSLRVQRQLCLILPYALFINKVLGQPVNDEKLISVYKLTFFSDLRQYSSI